MSMEEKVIEDFYEAMSEEMDTFIQILPALIPSNEDDARILRIAVDMMNTIKEDILSSETLCDVDNVLDVDKLVNDWDRVKDKVCTITTSNLYQIAEEVEKEFVGDEDL